APPLTDQLRRGLYELLITADLNARLEELGDRLTAERQGLHSAEAANRISLHLARAIERHIESIGEDDRVSHAIDIARDLLARLDADSDAPVASDPVLRAILGRRPDGSPEQFESPLTPLLDTTLLTNAPGEPRVGR